MNVYIVALFLLVTTNVFSQTSDSLIKVAVSHAQKGDYYKAKTVFNQAFKVCDDEEKQASILNNLALIYMLTDEPDTAAIFFQEAAQIYISHNNKPILGKIYSNLGVLYKKTYQYPKALAFYKKSLHYAPKSSDTKNNIAQIYYKQKDYLNALSYLDRNTKNPRFLNNIARCFTYLNRPDSAAHYFNRALSKTDTTKASVLYTDILLHHATLLYRQDSLHAALQQYKKGIAVHKQLQHDYLKQSKYLTNTVYQRLYCAAIEIAAKLNLPEEAFSLSEENKSPVLLQSVSQQPVTQHTTLSVDSLLQSIPDNAVSLSYSYTDSLLVTIIADQSGVSTLLNPIDESFTAAIDTFTTHTLTRIDAVSDYLAFFQASNHLFPLLIPVLPRKVTRLLISPYGKLHNMSFDALTLTPPKENHHFFGVDFLLNDYAITYVPSLNIYNCLKAPGTVERMAFFAPTDYNNLNLDEISVETIEKMKKSFEQYSPVDYYPGLATNKENLFSEGYDIISVVTHGKNSRLFINSDSVSAVEISKQKLNNHLTVLTACLSGAGKTVSNEGMLSLGYAYLEAGSHSVLHATSVIDARVSQIIMSDFFKYLDKGYPKDVALQKAKLNYSKSESGFWSALVWWSNYNLVGDNSPVTFTKKDNCIYWLIAGMLGLILSGILLFVSKKNQ